MNAFINTLSYKINIHVKHAFSLQLLFYFNIKKLINEM